MKSIDEVGIASFPDETLGTLAALTELHILARTDSIGGEIHLAWQRTVDFIAGDEDMTTMTCCHGSGEFFIPSALGRRLQCVTDE